MASSTKHLPLAFLLFLAATASLRVQARESQFFSKAVRYEPSTETASIPEETSAAKSIDPATLYPQNPNGYGLYGHGPEELNPTTTTASYNTNTNTNTNTNYNGELSNQYNTKATIEGDYKNTKPRSTAYSSTSSSVYPSERQGMSDTRFLENGKYYHDVEAENYPNGFDPTSENSERYGSYNNGVGARRGGYGNGGYNYGSNSDRYVYNNNAMENNQEEYIP